jgi:hypothetical protein
VGGALRECFDIARDARDSNLGPDKSCGAGGDIYSNYHQHTFVSKNRAIDFR